MRGTRILAVVGLLLIVAACSSDGNGDERASSTTESGSNFGSTGSTGSTSDRTSTTLGPAPAAGTAPFVEINASSGTDGVSPEGSGCAPGTLDALPDGQWFGTLAFVDPAAGTLDLDLACLFFNAAANAAATADGASEVPVPDDVYVRNENPAVHTEPVVPDVAVAFLENGGGSATFEPTVSGLEAAAPIAGRAVWIHVVGGWVVAIQQQYFP